MTSQNQLRNGLRYPFVKVQQETVYDLAENNDTVYTIDHQAITFYKCTNFQILRNS